VWGGVRDEDVDASSAGLEASLVSMACDGGKGGDIYYFSVCDADLLTRVAIADVVGHGNSVSRISEWLCEAMKERMNALEGNAVLAELNRRAVERGLEAMTTAGVAAFYRADGCFYFSYAGHHEMLIRRRNEARWAAARLERESAAPANLPLGVLAEVEYSQRKMPLYSGDRFLLYTDGVIEAPNRARELFGLPRLLDVLDSAADRPLGDIKRSILSALKRHTAGSLAHDDVTLLILEIR
jgi:sigma-B regulation protein RsbU (phosphoserine phosphatase)